MKAGFICFIAGFSLKAFEWIRPEHMEPTGDKELGQIRALLEEQISECRELLKEL